MFDGEVVMSCNGFDVFDFVGGDGYFKFCVIDENCLVNFFWGDFFGSINCRYWVCYFVIFVGWVDIDDIVNLGVFFEVSDDGGFVRVVGFIVVDGDF